ncbi:hypothetical protein HD806DRAFT_530265 [Xylariaceae sp. AK1471]|nr:hypothetical protein HD806DRAFT_530265 [Xylariaceae sp. AK1471]
MAQEHEIISTDTNGQRHFSNMDAVEKLFEALPDPDVDRQFDGATTADQTMDALHKFLEEPPSQDPDYQYLKNHAKHTFCIKRPFAASYFRQQLAHYATQRPVQRKDKSQKARQFKYYRWIAHGKKDETYPFATGKLEGPGSVTKIAALVGSTSCAACNKKAVNYRCPSCNFQDNVYVVEKTTYCNKDCLKDHHETHKPVCEGRKSIYRAASLLSSIFNTIAKNTYTYPLSKVFDNDGILYPICDGWERAGMTGRPIFWPFPRKTALPNNLAKSVVEDMRHALLVWGQSEEIRYSLHELVEYLFGPICKSIKRIYLVPKNVKRPICEVSGEKAYNNCLFQHTVLRVKLKSGESYAIDLTAAQFGWTETLAPWNTWASLRCLCETETETEPTARPEKISTDKEGMVKSEQQKTRVLFISSLIKSLKAMAQGLYSRDSFNTILMTHDDDAYDKLRGIITADLRDDIDYCLKRECNKNFYRLFLSPIWLDEEEYDRLKESGTNMRHVWAGRANGKLKPAYKVILEYLDEMSLE